MTHTTKTDKEIARWIVTKIQQDSLWICDSQEDYDIAYKYISEALTDKSQEIASLTEKLKVAREGLDDIVSHYWVSTPTDEGKWINEFVEIAKNTLERMR